MLQIRNQVFKDNFRLTRPSYISESKASYRVTICDVRSLKDDTHFRTATGRDEALLNNILSHSYFPSTLEIFNYWVDSAPGVVLDDALQKCFNYRGLHFSNDCFDLRYSGKPHVVIEGTSYDALARYIRYGVFNKAVADYLIDVIYPLLEDEKNALIELSEFSFQEEFDLEQPLTLDKGGVARKEKCQSLFNSASYVKLSGLTFDQCLGKLTVGQDYVKLSDLSLVQVELRDALKANLPTIDTSDLQPSFVDAATQAAQEQELEAAIDYLMNTPYALRNLAL